MKFYSPIFARMVLNTKPVVETDELTTDYWRHPQTTIKVTVTCAKCGEACRLRYEDERDESCSD